LQRCSLRARHHNPTASRANVSQKRLSSSSISHLMLQRSLRPMPSLARFGTEVNVQPGFCRSLGPVGSAALWASGLKAKSSEERVVDKRLNSTGRLIQRTTAMHGEDDQICPFPTTGARSVKLLKHGTLKSCPGLPHGMPTTHADQINADLLALVQQQSGEPAA
jgi:pimeloyl-ACP methyl ester carboxylesterase